MKFSIVITTYNRKFLLERCIRAALSQRDPDLEIIVVEDASTDGTKEYITNKYPNIRYVQNTNNRGPSYSRNFGIDIASNNWIVIVDDDDTLLPDAIQTISKTLSEFSHDYPVYNFAISNGHLTKGEHFLVIHPKEYMENRLNGDFVPVINRQVFLASGYQYPNLKIGGEYLLWLKVASQHGIPTWNTVISQLHTDAETRLTDYSNQITKAPEFAEYQDLLIQNFEPLFLEFSRKKLIKLYLGSITYHILSKNKRTAFTRYKRLIQLSKPCFPLIILFIIPSPLLIRIFLLYRKMD